MPIIDAMLAYDCERTNQVYFLVLRNVLYIESMDDNLIPPFILREAGLTVHKRAKIHCEEGTVIEEDHTIQEFRTGLFITMQLKSIFSYFPTQKPNLDDLDDGIEVMLTPEGPSWDAYDQTFVDNRRSMTNRHGHLRPSTYVHKDFVEEDDIANINSIMVFDNINHCNKDAIIAAFEAQEVAFTKEEIDIGYKASKVAAAAVKPFSSDWNPVYESMPLGQD